MSEKRKTAVRKSSKPTKRLEEVRELPPKTRALHGLLKDTDLDEKDYKAHLSKKYLE